MFFSVMHHICLTITTVQARDYTIMQTTSYVVIYPSLFPTTILSQGPSLLPLQSIILAFHYSWYSVYVQGSPSTIQSPSDHSSPCYSAPPAGCWHSYKGRDFWCCTWDQSHPALLQLAASHIDTKPQGAVPSLAHRFLTSRKDALKIKSKMLKLF